MKYQRKKRKKKHYFLRERKPKYFLDITIMTSNVREWVSVIILFKIYEWSVKEFFVGKAEV